MKGVYLTEYSLGKATLILSLFAIAMGFMESAVVVYLRAIYYPEGFAFPLKVIEGPVAVTEVVREAATVVMLATVAMMAARQWLIRFAWFIYLFGIWDIFYYVFLWLLLGWPESLFTWDILFLIPTVWVGPVLAPVINSLTMIGLAMVILIPDRRSAFVPIPGTMADESGKVRLRLAEWCLLGAGALITIIAYTLEYSSYILERFSLADLISSSGHTAVLQRAAEFIPASFNWWLFCCGELLFLAVIMRFLKFRE